jgi:hypothetical protein
MPQQAWLTSRGGGGFGRGGGASLAPGVTVFFRLPDGYNGSTAATLTFTTASGAEIRSVTLHPRTSGRPSAASSNPAAARGQPDERLTSVEAGMNRFQWDMRYPEAAEVKGIFHSGFSASNPIGPEVVPGTYYVTLTYGATTQKQPFVVKLDPRLSTTQAELQQRFNLLMQLHDAVNRLDTNLNQAIDARDSLAKAMDSGHATDARSHAVLENLNRDIDNLVDLRIQSGEGALVYPPRLRSWLSAITGQVEMALVPPTPAMVQVANGYIREAGAGVARLQSDLAAARGAVP